MIPSDSQQLESYLPVYDTIPESWEEGRQFLIEQLKKISNAVNAREIGFFLDEELLTGKGFIPGTTQAGDNPGLFRQILRKVIVFGTLPNNTTKSVAHNITFDGNFTLLDMYISATDPVNFLAFSVQYWANSAPGSIILNMNATNVNVTTTSNYSAYTRSFIVLEYTQEL